MTVKERITALREVMAEKKIDAYLVPTDDFHASEYVREESIFWKNLREEEGLQFVRMSIMI